MENRAFDYSRYKDWIDPAEVTPYAQNAKKHDERQIPIIINAQIKNKFVKKITIAVGVILATIFVAAELHIVYNLPILLTWATVAAGQAITQIIGIPIFAAINTRLPLEKIMD